MISLSFRNYWARNDPMIEAPRNLHHVARAQWSQSFGADAVYSNRDYGGVTGSTLHLRQGAAGPATGMTIRVLDFEARRGSRAHAQEGGCAADARIPDRDAA